MKHFYFLCFTLLFFLGISNSHAQQKSSVYFKNGDVICFLGDSITHGGQYHEFLQLFYATRYPELKLSFHNCGISGDNAAGMVERFEEDVMKHNPTHVFLMTGMNDVIRTLYFEGIANDKILNQRNTALENYKKQTKLLLEKIKAQQVVPVLLTPSIYDQYSKIEKENNLGCNDALIECSNHIKKLGNKYDALVIDLNTPMKELMERELKKDSLFTIVGKDRVHPGTTGHFIMFEEIISALEPETMVSKITIELYNDEHSIKNENVALRNVQLSDSLISFQTHENSLPFPLGNYLDKALSLTSFMDVNNQQLLQVEGLKNGAYDLFIENVFIDRFSTQELSSGVNLATKENTPHYKQAQEIKRLCSAYRQTQFQLRAVAFIRHSYLNDYKGPEDIKLMQRHLTKKLKIIEGKPYYNYIKKNMEAYFETLPKIDSLKNRLDTIQNIIYFNNTPQQLGWRLVKQD